MNKYGHWGVACLFAVIPVYGLSISISTVIGFFFLLGCISSARLPDQAEINLPIINIEHRGVTHTALFTVAAALVAGIGGYIIGSIVSDVSPISASAAGWIGFSSVLCGVSSHLVADSLTIGGEYRVTPWWPISSRTYQMGLTKANNTIWNFGFLTTGALAQLFSIVLVIRS